jgi:hypothetical protein
VGVGDNTVIQRRMQSVACAVHTHGLSVASLPSASQIRGAAATTTFRDSSGRPDAGYSPCIRLTACPCEMSLRVVCACSRRCGMGGHDRRTNQDCTGAEVDQWRAWPVKGAAVV